MFSRLKNSANENARFYQVPANMEEVKSGYMYKSPPQTFLFRSLKSWKRRYFVLTRTNENHYELKFFKDENKREKPLGQINLYQITLLHRKTESHPIMLWIQRNFKCSASCVLYMSVAEREYFLIGENSSDTEDWFNAIFKALNTHVATKPDLGEIKKQRSISEPPISLSNHNQEKKETDQNPSSSSSNSLRQSAPESFNSQYDHYDYPKNYMKTASQSLESEDTEEDEEDAAKTIRQSETEEDTSYYMEMGRVLEGNDVSKDSFLQTGNEDISATPLNRQILPKSETFIPVEKEICVSQDELRNSVIFSEETGKLCVSSLRDMQSSGLFHEGDQILAINDLLTDSVTELQTYLKRLNKNQVKLTILRQPGSQPLSGCCS